MLQLFYCLDCRRISESDEACNYCQSTRIKALVKDAPVNIIGTKQKGRVLHISDQGIKILMVDEHKNRLIKEFSPDKIRKVI